MIILDVSAASWTGRVRSQNEDMVLVDNHFIREDTYHTEFVLGREDRLMLAVADGMGGHNRGDVASNDTLHNLHYYFYDIPSFKGMGTTLVGLVYYNRDFYSLNCGDSRLYRFRNHQLVQLTTDHSLSNMTGSDKRTNVITNCIGGGCNSSFIDMVQMTGDMFQDDVFLLCSDGLTDMLSDEAISELLDHKADANALCSAAIEAGGADNVSCCVITIK